MCGGGENKLGYYKLFHQMTRFTRKFVLSSVGDTSFLSPLFDHQGQRSHAWIHQRVTLEQIRASNSVFLVDANITLVGRNLIADFKDWYFSWVYRLKLWHLTVRQHIDSCYTVFVPTNTLYLCRQIHCILTNKYTVFCPTNTLYSGQQIHCILADKYTVFWAQNTLYSGPQIHCILAHKYTVFWQTNTLHSCRPNTLYSYRQIHCISVGDFHGNGKFHLLIRSPCNGICYYCIDIAYCNSCIVITYDKLRYVAIVGCG